jgi:hypothetical protein
MQLGQQLLARLRRDDHGEAGPVGQRAAARAARGAGQLDRLDLMRGHIGQELE